VNQRPPRILSIAGSDSSGGAGIQADIKTITMLGGYAMSAITAATAQNSVGVQAITPLSGDFVRAQIDSCVNDIGVDAIKIGMLHDADIVGNVCDALEQLPKDIPVVVDPVMVSTSGANLIAQGGVLAMEDRLFPLATIITPNLPELEFMAERKFRTSELLENAAREMALDLECFVLAKGGHTADAQVMDILLSPEGGAKYFMHERVDTPHTHGTGCTLSAAIATLLGHGQDMEDAVRLAREFVLRAIRSAPGLGAGNGPLGHYAVRGEG